MESGVRRYGTARAQEIVEIITLGGKRSGEEDNRRDLAGWDLKTLCFDAPHKAAVVCCCLTYHPLIFVLAISRQPLTRD
jgi:hypothetical protein